MPKNKNFSEIISNLSLDIGILIAFILFGLQYCQTKSDKKKLLEVMQNLMKVGNENKNEIRKLKDSINNLLKNLSELPNNLSSVNSPKTTLSIENNILTSVETNGNSLNISTQEINNQNKVELDRILISDNLVSNDNDLTLMLDDFHYFVKDKSIYKFSKNIQLDELGITLSKYGNKSISVRFALTDNHFNEIRNNEIYIVEPFEKLWKYKFHSIMLDNIDGKLYMELNNRGDKRKHEILNLFVSKHSKEIIVTSIKENDNIKLNLFVDNYNIPIDTYIIPNIQ